MPIGIDEVASVVAAEAGVHGSALFSFEAGPYRDGQLRVVRFKGRERVNGLFEFRVELAVAGADLTTLETVLLGQVASLVFGDEPSRAVHGIVSNLEFAGVHTGTDEPRVVVKLVPRAWLMRHRHNSRIFQEKTTQEIVTILLTEHGIANRWQLAATYQRRVYCVQFQETDWEFITRLLAEDGVFFYFKHPDVALSELTGGVSTAIGAAANLASSMGGAVGAALGRVGAALDPMETLVFADRPQAYPPISSGGPDVAGLAFEAGSRISVTDAFGQLSSATGVFVGVSPALVLRDEDGMLPREHYVSKFSLRRAVRTKSVLLRRYDFRKPRVDLRGEAAVDAGAVRVSIGVGGASSARAAIALDAPLAIDAALLRNYHHHAEDEEPDFGRVRAQTFLEQHRADRNVGRGASWCRRLAPGHRFTLEEHGIAKLDGEYVITSVVHEGASSSAFGGEAGGQQQQAYHNRFECLPSSVPARPPQPPVRTHQTLEPARVVGPPGEDIYTDEFGRIKVQFFWDNDGRFNEFSSCWIRVVQNWSGSSWGFQFVPRVGMEVLVSFQYADQDRPVALGCLYNGENPYPFAVPSDRTRSGIRSQSSPGGSGYNELSFQDLTGREQVYLRAQKDLDEAVGHDHTLHVKHDERLTIDNDQDLEVKRDQQTRVGRNRTLDVVGTDNTSIGAGRAARVGGTDHTLVLRHGFYTTRENYNLQVGRIFNTYVGSDREPGGMNIWSWGPCQWGTNTTHMFEAQDKITLRVGESVIEMTPDTIKFKSPHMVMDGTEDTIIRGKDPMITLNDTAHLVSKEVKIQSKGVTVKMDDALFRVEAPSHILTSGSGAAADERKKVTGETKPFKLQLTNSQFEPYANRPFELVVGTLRFKGTTTGAGEVIEDVPKDAHHATVQLWIGDPPTGATRIIQVEIVDALPAASSIAGLKLRLSHLGYYQGEMDEIVDGGLREAVRQFQQDHDMAITGEPGDIAGRVTDVHGA